MSSKHKNKDLQGFTIHNLHSF